MNCPQCGFTLDQRLLASALGSLGKGRKKRLTAEQRAVKRDRLAVLRARRWPAKFTEGTGNNETKGTE